MSIYTLVYAQSRIECNVQLTRSHNENDTCIVRSIANSSLCENALRKASESVCPQTISSSAIDQDLRKNPAVKKKKRNANSKRISQIDTLPSIPELSKSDKSVRSIEQSCKDCVKPLYYLNTHEYKRALKHAQKHALRIDPRTTSSVESGQTLSRPTGRIADTIPVDQTLSRPTGRIADTIPADTALAAGAAAAAGETVTVGAAANALPYPDKDRQTVTARQKEGRGRNIKHTDIQKIEEWTHAICTWTLDIEQKLHAINEGMRIIDGLTTGLQR